MSESLDEIMARHDALTACGCTCCDSDYCAYVDCRKPRRKQTEAMPPVRSKPNDLTPRASLREIVEMTLSRFG
ncbi:MULTISPECIES: hypothetical protein [unclassified Ruegeria]|uniref:hypothetical protein n=1 Tax=unclassified Ruegeria TaxID=2625375 RepID=UPI00148939F0|nr:MULTISPECIES: hypothetical protein [unclassified Ruegeria]NOD63983.1 hypothetical protein [Ruegeria sp. HKCCD6109]